MNQETPEQTAARQIEQLETMIKPHLSKEAWSRYSTLKLAHPEKAIRSLVAVGQLSQKRTQPFSDQEFKQVLIQLGQKGM